MNHSTNFFEGKSKTILISFTDFVTEKMPISLAKFTTSSEKYLLIVLGI
ncbi:hypothetical protein [Hydrocoleum sp. CS-953]|nr:hypothetical protein [Hydrocoleum sp. CS-953]